MLKLTELLPPLTMAFIITVGFAPVTIPFLHRLKFGQSIREDGPTWHKAKAGTPTMGGFLFVIAITVSTLLFASHTKDFQRALTVLLMSLSFGFVGFIDDYIKVIKKRNLGLTAKQKYILQLLCAGVFLFVMELQGANSTSVPVPFTSFSLELGFAYYPLAMIAITAVVNAVNLTDGLDGLATSVTIPVLLFYLYVAYTKGFPGNAVLLTAAAGALAGYLIFNWHPAKVMMGDTGALFLGGLLAGVMFSMRAQLIFIICGFIYIAEVLSDVIQVGYFKATKGKRFFKMAPLHHHFELCGWKEVKIVLVFAGITIVLCLLSTLGV